MKRIALLIAAALFSVSALAADAGAPSQYPSKPIKLICPYPAGGASDIVSRAIGQQLNRELGVPVIVENHPGAGSTIGSEIGASAPPDGYTLTMTSSPLFAVVPLLYSHLSYEPKKAFSSVMVLASFTNVLTVKPQLKVHSVKELIALAKREPGKLTYASTGNGSTVHLSAEMFKAMTGTNMLHVPYKGSPPAVTDLLAGRVDMMFNNTPNMMPYIKSGKVRALAVTSAKRDPVLPDVPTMAEAGVPGYEAVGWFSLSVPAGTPKAIITRLNQAAAKGIRAPEFMQSMKGIGFSVVGGTPEQMDQMIDTEIRRWGPVVHASGAKID